MLRCAGIICLLICPSIACGQFVAQHGKYFPGSLEVEFLVPNDYENLRISVQQIASYQDIFSVYGPSKILTAHNVRKSDHSLESGKTKCDGNPYGVVRIVCPIKSGLTYRFSLVDNVDCMECVEELKRAHGESNPKLVAERLRREEQFYGVNIRPADRAVIVSNPDQLLQFDRDEIEFDEYRLYKATTSFKTGAFFDVTCLDAYGDGKWIRNVHNPFDDAYKLRFFQQIAEGAYKWQNGAKVTGGYNRFAAGDERPPARPDYKSFFFGRTFDSPFTKRGFRLWGSTQFEVVEVIEGAEGAFEPAKKHPILGVIPNGFRAIVMAPIGDKSIARIIGYAGTDNFIDWKNGNLSQGIGIFDFPWNRPDNKFDPNIPYGTIYYVSPYESRVSAQYQFALAVARYVCKGRFLDDSLPLAKNVDDADRVVVCGHSLGGGLANYVSLKFGIRGYGFNAAALASAAQDLKYGVAFQDLYFTHVRSSLDPVSLITPSRPFLLLPRLGKQIGDHFIVGSNASTRFFGDHFIDTLDTSVIVDYLPPESASAYELHVR